MFYLVEKCVDAGNYALVCHWLDRAGCEELDAGIVVRENFAAGRDFARSVYPVEGAVDSAELTCVAGGPHGAER